MNMYEKMPTGPTPEEIEEQEQEERYQQWLIENPEVIILPEDRRECGPEIAEFEELITAFESNHSLEELHAITGLTPDEAPKHPVRGPARLALYPIVKLMNTLKEETNITIERHDELKAKYKRLSLAVGMINNNRVRHE